jgi:hypothetical protein
LKKQKEKREQEGNAVRGKLGNEWKGRNKREKAKEPSEEGGSYFPSGRK